MAVAGLALEGVVLGVLPPLLLREVRGALVAVDAGRVVLAMALEQVRILLRRRAHEGVAVAHAATANADLLDGVVVLRREKMWKLEPDLIRRLKESSC